MLIFASCKNIYVNESLFNASEETIRAKYGVPYFEKTYLVTSEYKNMKKNHIIQSISLQKIYRME